MTPLTRPSLDRRAARLDSTLDAVRRLARLPGFLQDSRRFDRSVVRGREWGGRLGGALSIGIVVFGVGLALYSVLGRPED